MGKFLLVQQGPYLVLLCHISLVRVIGHRLSLISSLSCLTDIYLINLNIIPLNKKTPSSLLFNYGPPDFSDDFIWAVHIFSLITSSRMHSNVFFSQLAPHFCCTQHSQHHYTIIQTYLCLHTQYHGLCIPTRIFPASTLYPTSSTRLPFLEYLKLETFHLL